MPATPYAGHAATSAAKAAATTPDDVAPADRPSFDPTDPQWAEFPGAAAAAKGYPRH